MPIDEYHASADVPVVSEATGPMEIGKKGPVALKLTKRSFVREEDGVKMK